VRNVETMNPAENIISLLGGLTKTAALLSTDEKRMPISTVQGWKDRSKIPQEWWIPLMEAAKGEGKVIELEMFLTVPEGAQ